MNFENESESESSSSLCVCVCVFPVESPHGPFNKADISFFVWLPACMEHALSQVWLLFVCVFVCVCGCDCMFAAICLWVSEGELFVCQSVSSRCLHVGTCWGAVCISENDYVYVFNACTTTFSMRVRFVSRINKLSDEATSNHLRQMDFC